MIIAVAQVRFGDLGLFLFFFCCHSEGAFARGICFFLGAATYEKLNSVTPWELLKSNIRDFSQVVLASNSTKPNSDSPAFPRFTRVQIGSVLAGSGYADRAEIFRMEIHRAVATL